MLGVRGPDPLGCWVPREEEQKVRPTEWFKDLRLLAPRDQWYRLGRSLTDRERETTGLDKVRSMDQMGRDILARLEKWTSRLIVEHGLEWEYDSIRTKAVYLETEKLAAEIRKGPRRWTQKLKLFCRQLLDRGCTSGRTRGS